MCVGSAGRAASAGENFKSAAKEAAKHIGTGPTPIEKKVGEVAVEALKAAAPFSLLGDAFILGGAGAAAIKFLEKQNSDLPKELAKDAIIGAAGAAIAPINPIA